MKRVNGKGERPGVEKPKELDDQLQENVGIAGATIEPDATDAISFASDPVRRITQLREVARGNLPKAREKRQTVKQLCPFKCSSVHKFDGRGLNNHLKYTCDNIPEHDRKQLFSTTDTLSGFGKGYWEMLPTFPEILWAIVGIRFDQVLDFFFKFLLLISFVSIIQLMLGGRKTTAIGGVWQMVYGDKNQVAGQAELFGVNMVCMGWYVPSCQMPEDISFMVVGGDFDEFKRTSCGTFSKYMDVYKQRCGYPTALFFKNHYLINVARKQDFFNDVVKPNWWSSGEWNGQAGVDSVGHPTSIPLPYSDASFEADLKKMARSKGVGGEVNRSNAPLRNPNGVQINRNDMDEPDE